MTNKINILILFIIFICFQNLSKLFSGELIFDGHIKYELLKKFDINKNEIVRYYQSTQSWTSNAGVMGVNECITKQIINANNETLFRDTTCQSEDNEGKVFYRVGKSLRGGDGAFLDQTKFVSGEGRWKLLEGKTCLLAYSTISGNSIEGYLTSKMVCEVPENIFNGIKNYKND